MSASTPPAPLPPDPDVPEPAQPEPRPPETGTAAIRLAIGALGIVFGDIGTSPLYAFRESFIGTHKLPIDPLHVHGVLSLIVWALIMVVTVKYVLITMRAGNHGEGGSFALLALIRRLAPTSRLLPAVSLAALLATALFYGDAVITPAISILSAVEGVTLAEPGFSVAVVPVTLLITVALFAIQHRGTAVVARFFGPVMLVWFTAIGLLGAINVLGQPGMLLAASPSYAFALIAEDPLRAFLTLGTVVLTITGAEALFADMGHFGRRPISVAWLAVVLPSLLLCYAGQAALVLRDPAAIGQCFYLLAPNWALWPLLALATAATVIASQSAITGAFSLTMQAIQLGYVPRLTILHTSETERGQIYAPAVNAMIGVTVIGLVLGFRSSAALAAAFGFAVTSTMVLTTLMMGIVIFGIWRWRPILAVPLYAVLLAFDLALFGASATKIPDGAWLPLVIAASLMLLFTTWARGRELLAARLISDSMPVGSFLRDTEKVPRMEGYAVYFTRHAGGVPRALLHSLKHFHSLHERIVLVSLRTDLVPRVPPGSRVEFSELGHGVGGATLTFGYLDAADVPEALTHLPPGRVVELGSQVEI